MPGRGEVVKRPSLHPDMMLRKYMRPEHWAMVEEDIRAASARKSQRSNLRRMRFHWAKLNRLDLARENRWRKQQGWEPL